FSAVLPHLFSLFFFYSLRPHRDRPSSLHDALPICRGLRHPRRARVAALGLGRRPLFAVVGGWVLDPAGLGPRLLRPPAGRRRQRSEEHTSELQSRENLVCRLLLEKKKKNSNKRQTT